MPIWDPDLNTVCEMYLTEQFANILHQTAILAFCSKFRRNLFRWTKGTGGVKRPPVVSEVGRWKTLRSTATVPGDCHLGMTCHITSHITSYRFVEKVWLVPKGCGLAKSCPVSPNLRLKNFLLTADASAFSRL